jgi:5-methylcytosine-specific restriction endonuclease McrA
MGLQRQHRVLTPRARGDRRRKRHRPARHHKRATKRATMRDCSRRCVYCAKRLTPDTATLDHVCPVSRGGTHAPGNLVIACHRCNQLKGDTLPLDFFTRYPWAGSNFMRYARAVHRGLKRAVRRTVSLAYAA